jgi:hypothetical protein
MTWRNIKECEISSASGNANLEMSPYTIHRGSESFELIDIHVDSYSTSNIPPVPLIYL